MTLITNGVAKPAALQQALSLKPQWKTDSEVTKAQGVLLEYHQVGAIKEITDCSPTKHLIPWFLICKEEGTKEKVRLIADCRELNCFFQTKHFKLDHLHHIFPLLKPGMWGAKIDLRHAYFHLAVEERLRPYLRLQVGNKLWEFQAAPFGLNVLPQMFMMVMKTFQRKWAKKGILNYIYLDDILLLGTTELQSQTIWQKCYKI